jgi:hypothetical protein
MPAPYAVGIPRLESGRVPFDFAFFLSAAPPHQPFHPSPNLPIPPICHAAPLRPGSRHTSISKIAIYYVIILCYHGLRLVAPLSANPVTPG